MATTATRVGGFGNKVVDFKVRHAVDEFEAAKASNFNKDNKLQSAARKRFNINYLETGDFNRVQ
jgi:hypothetical protein